MSDMGDINSPLCQRSCRFYSRCKGKSKEQNPHTHKFVTDIRIKRHVKIRADATPYDPEYKDYFKERKQNKNQTDCRTVKNGL